MTRWLEVLSAGPGVSVQDQGRPGWLGVGVPRGGAMDRLALAEGAALLGQGGDLAALECAGMGLEAIVRGGAVRLAVTGAQMPLVIDGTAVPPNTSALAQTGARITLGGARAGIYGYLHVDGGIATPRQLGARSRYAAADLGQAIENGQHVPLGPPHPGPVAMTLAVADRLSGGDVRLVESYQSDRFSAKARAELANTPFRRSALGNRMGVRLDGGHFPAQGGLQILSDIICPGDVQMTGDGAPFVLMSDCQTTGGYPRIGTVLACDLPRLAQAAPGAPISLTWVDRATARAALQAHRAAIAAFPAAVQPRVRDPRDIPDLLRYDLVSGAITGWDIPPETEGQP